MVIHCARHAIHEPLHVTVDTRWRILEMRVLDFHRLRSEVNIKLNPALTANQQSFSSMKVDVKGQPPKEKMVPIVVDGEPNSGQEVGIPFVQEVMQRESHQVVLPEPLQPQVYIRFRIKHQTRTPSSGAWDLTPCGAVLEDLG